MDSKSLGYAGSETIGLHQCGNQRSNVVYASTRGKVPQRFRSRFAGAHFQIDHVELIAKFSMSMPKILTDPH